MSTTEVTNPGVINAGSESFVRPIVANPDGLPPPTVGESLPIPAPRIPDAEVLPVVTNPPQDQLPSEGAPVSVFIK